MDDPELEPGAHREALEALALVGALSLTAGRIWSEIRRRVRAGGWDPARPFRLLDVACGGGDTVLTLKRRAEREGVTLEAHGCDLSPRAVAHAEDRSRRRGLEASFFQLDVLRSPLPSGFDLVCSSLFLHHLVEEQVAEVLSRMADSGKAVYAEDLRRSRMGYWLAWGTLRLLSGSRVAHEDGPLSVQASFRIPEVAALARKAGMEGATVVPCWPQRFMLQWERNP